MMQIFRRWSVLVVLLVLTILIVPLTPILFLREFGPFTSFGPVPWFGVGDWCYLAICFVFLGRFLFRLLKPPAALPGAIGFGLAYSFDRWLNASYGLSASTSLIDYFWLYGDLLISPLAALAGSRWGQLVARRKQQLTHAA